MKELTTQTKLLINGELVEGDGTALPIIDPSTGGEVTSVNEASDEQVDAAIRGCEEAFETFRKTTPAERSALLLKIADVLEENSQELAELESLDVGKPWPSAHDDEMQEGWNDPSRFILGHPFNPPHLIPLVELLANDKTSNGVLEIAEIFYREVGKVTIRVNKEVPGHVANRLQAALWREAIHLVNEGIASVEDVDTAVWSGPGLRWAAMGPTMLFNLGAGEGGLTSFCERYTDSFNRWWDDLGDPRLNPEIAEKLIAGVKEEAAGKSAAELAKHRDQLITGMLKKNQSTR